MTGIHAHTQARAEAVERVLRGEDPAIVAAEYDVTPSRLSAWVETFLEAGRRQLANIDIDDARVENTAGVGFLPDEHIDEGLRLAREAAGLGIYYTDLERDVIRWDDRMYSFWGFPKDERLTTESVMAGVHPDDREPVMEAYGRAYDGVDDGRYVAEYRVVRRSDGDVRWIIANGQVIFEDGRPVRFLGTAQDITERKRTEDALRRSDETLSAIIEALPVGIAVATGTGEMLTANPAGLRMHGFATADDLLKKFEQYSHEFSAFYPDGRAMPPEEWPWARAARGEYVKDYETFLRRSGHPDRTLNYATIPIHGDTPDDSLIVFVIQDVTEYKRVQAELERNLTQSRAIFRQMTDGLLVFDRDGNLLDANRAALSMHDSASMQDMPSNPDEVLPMFEVFDLRGNPLPQPEWPISRVLRGETFLAYEIRLRAARSHHEWIGSYGGTPLYDANGEMQLGVITLRDVTAQHEAESALREADRRKDVFLATLAHELRNPLAPISSALGLLRSRFSDPLVQQPLDIIDRQLRQLVRLVDDLLDVSRISRGKIVLQRELASIHVILEQALESSRPHIDAARQELHVALPSEPAYVDGDALRLAQVFQNLLNNASKFSPPGGRIEVTATREGPEVVIVVRDDGSGIDAEHLPHIFEMFAQPTPRPDAPQTGLGIGLSVAQSLVEMHEGRIEAHSDGPGRGAAFVVRLPAADRPRKSEDSQPGVRKLRSRHPRQVLIVDDNHDAANALAMFLRAAGNEVAVANDGPTAVDHVAQHRPEVVFLDIGMPNVDGYETCRRLRALPRSAEFVIFAFTGWGEDDDQRRTREAGFDRHLVKPVAPTTLLDLLDNLESARDA